HFADQMRRSGSPARKRWLERNLRSAELLTTDDKLLAGLDNYGTYFGRDSLMTALMMEGVWSGAMLEHALGSVVRRISSEGRDSHEESLGMQAYRENIQAYNAVLARAVTSGGEGGAPLREARDLGGKLFRHREDYQMVDTEFMVPLLAARYLARPDV